MEQVAAGVNAAYVELISLHTQLLATCVADELPTEHREKNPDHSRMIYPCHVARKVPKSEFTKPEVVKAIAAEREKHRNAPWP